MDHSLIRKSKEKALMSIQVALFGTQETGKIIYPMAEGLKFMQMVLSMKEVSKKELKADKAFTNGKVENFMKESLDRAIFGVQAPS